MATSGAQVAPGTGLPSRSGTWTGRWSAVWTWRTRVRPLDSSLHLSAAVQPPGQSWQVPARWECAAEPCAAGGMHKRAGSGAIPALSCP